jgi:aryl-alcohol dehydrogenase-like predicted oxidoreductase
MRTATLGQSGLVSSAQALGCMGMSEFYGVGDEAENQAVLSRAVELGITHLDTSDLYGRGENERLLGRFLKARSGGRDGLLIATKFGILRDPDGALGSTDDRALDNSPAHARAACEASLQRLGIDCIDLYYLHRHDPAVPIEEVVGAMGDLMKEGKIRAIGLSEISADTLRRAHATVPIAALQSEYSLFARGVERDILPACRALGVGFMAYSPLGRGILAGRITSLDDLAPDDLRRSAPMYAPDNLPTNLALVDRVRALAERHGATAGQVALAWLQAKGEDVIPLPGTKRVRYLEENAAATDLVLSPSEIAELEAAVSPDAVAGAGRWSTLQQDDASR